MSRLAVFDDHALVRLTADVGRTGSHNQGEIAARFGVTVTPATDFLAFDASATLRAMLDCKATNDGGIARDKATDSARCRTGSRIFLRWPS